MVPYGTFGLNVTPLFLRRLAGSRDAQVLDFSKNVFYAIIIISGILPSTR